MAKRKSADPKEDSQNGRWPSWLPHVGRAARWLFATVVAAAIGVGVTAVLSGGGSSSDDKGGSSSDDRRNSPAFPESRLVSSERIGLYRVEENGTSQGALNALGQPSKQERPEGSACVMTWKAPDLTINFGNLGGADPCLYGSFCSANVGRGWATTKGLEVGESVRRMQALYPDAERLSSGAIDVYVLEKGTQLCGRDAKGGLEAWTASGKVFGLHVSFMAGGD